MKRRRKPKAEKPPALLVDAFACPTCGEVFKNAEDERRCCICARCGKPHPRAGGPLQFDCPRCMRDRAIETAEAEVKEAKTRLRNAKAVLKRRWEAFGS